MWPPFSRGQEPSSTFCGSLPPPINYHIFKMAFVQLAVDGGGERMSCSLYRSFCITVDTEAAQGSHLLIGTALINCHQGCIKWVSLSFTH